MRMSSLAKTGLSRMQLRSLTLSTNGLMFEVLLKINITSQHVRKCDLLDVLKCHQKLFDITLGVYPHKKVHIEIEPGAKPVHERPYPVPCIHLSMYKCELDHLVDLGILIPQQESKWASPSFIIPKKDGSVRWISDLHS